MASFEMGICIGLAIFTAIFAYFCSKEENMGFKWFYLCLTFGVMTFSFNIMSRLATVAGYVDIVTILDGFTEALIAISSLIFFLFFIQVIRTAIELWFPSNKKKSFKEE